MFPIPDPSRLFPPRLPPSRGTGTESLASGILSLGCIGLVLGLAIGLGVLASRLSSWLAIPGGLIGLGVGTALCEGPSLLLGAIEALLYSFFTFTFTGGFERPDPVYSWTYAIVVAAIFLSAGYFAWKNR